MWQQSITIEDNNRTTIAINPIGDRPYPFDQPAFGVATHPVVYCYDHSNVFYLLVYIYDSYYDDMSFIAAQESLWLSTTLQAFLDSYSSIARSNSIQRRGCHA